MTANNLSKIKNTPVEAVHFYVANHPNALHAVILEFTVEDSDGSNVDEVLAMFAEANCKLLIKRRADVLDLLFQSEAGGIDIYCMNLKYDRQELAAFEEAVEGDAAIVLAIAITAKDDRQLCQIFPHPILNGYTLVEPDMTGFASGKELNHKTRF